MKLTSKKSGAVLFSLGAILALAIAVALSIASQAQSAPTRTIPARTIPVPTTVSPQMQRLAAPAWGGGMPVPQTEEQWKAARQQFDKMMGASLPTLRSQMGVTVVEQKIAGVRVYKVTPATIAPENRGRLLVHYHGGAYVFGGGEMATMEATLMAHFGRIEVLSVDYRMPPDFPFLAAVDDAVAVWKEVIKTHAPKSMGMFGTSAGGGLTLATVLKLKELGLPLPGAIMAGTPWSDLTKTGDSYFTNEFVDNVLGTEDGLLDACAKLYAGKHDLKEPLLSPVYGDLSGFPPTILLTGTRDLFLSNTVRVHQKLLQANVPASLLVFEAASHAQYSLVPDAPETAAAFGEVSKFFGAHLAK